MKKYRFYITDKEKAKKEMRTWFGIVNICIKDVLDAGYIDQYICTTPVNFANRIGSTKYEIIK